MNEIITPINRILLVRENLHARLNTSHYRTKVLCVYS